MKIILKLTRGGVDKLKLIRSKVNSGSGATPDNIGLRFTRGEYIYFMESDDIMMDNALEVFYNAAKNFNADVVHTDKYFQAPDEIVTTDINELKVVVKSSDVDISAAMLMSSNISERVDHFVKRTMRWEPWSNLIRRDFLMDYDIHVPCLKVAYDEALFIEILLTAKNIVLIPEALYVWRMRADSSCHAKLPPHLSIYKRAGDSFRGIKYLDEFMNKHGIFADNPEYRYKLFHFITNTESGAFLPLYTQIPAHLLDQFVRKTIDELGNSTALTAFLFSRMNVFNVQLNQYGAIIQQMNAHIQQQQIIIQKQAARIQQLDANANLEKT